MRICVFSDIHGNQYALRNFITMLSQLSIDSFIFCGDIFGYYYGQNEAIETLLRFDNLVWLLGNHDKNYIDLIDGILDTDSLSEKYGNSYELMAIHSSSASCADDIRGLRPIERMTVCGMQVAAVHGTISDPLNGRLYPKDADNLTALEDVDVCVMGHTHFRLYKRVGNTLYLNPGSIGQPRDKRKSCFAILSLPERSVEFFDVLYNNALLDAEILLHDAGNEKLLELLHRSD